MCVYTRIRHNLAVKIEAKVNPNPRTLEMSYIADLSPLSISPAGFASKFGLSGSLVAILAKYGLFC